MPYKKGSLKGQLTTAEIRKLISAHNKLSKITIPPRSTRDAIMSIISKAGFRVNHEQQKLEQTRATKKDVSLEKAKDVTKRVPKTEQQKKQSTERMEKKKVEKEKELKLAKKEGVKEFKAKKKEAEKKKPVQKPVEKPKKKSSTIGTQTDEKPKPVKKEKVLQLEDKKRLTPIQRTDKILKENGFTTLTEFKNKREEIHKIDGKTIPLKQRKILADYGNKILKELGEVPNLTAGKNIDDDLSNIERRFRFLADKLKKGEKVVPVKTDDKEKDEKPAKTEKTFKVERTERSKMISQLKQEYGNSFNPFKILGITASQETPELVKQRCRELRLKEHPDKGGDKEKFDMIQKACDVLMKTQKVLKKSGNDKDVGDAVKKPVSVKDIVDDLIANSDEKILPFTSLPSSSMLMYSEILERNKNDCSLPHALLLEKSNKLGMIAFLKEHSDEIAREIFRCHKHSGGKKAVVLPLGFVNKGKQGGTHANALVFNTIQMTAEHFEPHGIEDYVPARKGWLQLVGVNLAGGINAINKSLKKVAKEKGFPRAFSSGLKYVKPVDVCPTNSMYNNFRGVQSFDRSKKESVDFEGFTIKEKGGYCQLWTYFLLDLRLKTLDKPSQEVLKEYATHRDIYKNSIGTDPNKTMMGLIRGYSNNYFNMIRKLINEGKFSLEEFLIYRDINTLRKDKDKKKDANEIYNKISGSIDKESSEKMERVMKDAKM